MKNDKKIYKIISELSSQTVLWISTVSSLGNQDAYTDRIIENILSKSNELKTAYENQFKEVK